MRNYHTYRGETQGPTSHQYSLRRPGQPRYPCTVSRKFSLEQRDASSQGPQGFPPCWREHRFRRQCKAESPPSLHLPHQPTSCRGRPWMTDFIHLVQNMDERRWVASPELWMNTTHSHLAHAVFQVEQGHPNLNSMSMSQYRMVYIYI